MGRVYAEQVRTMMVLRQRLARDKSRRLRETPARGYVVRHRPDFFWGRKPMYKKKARDRKHRKEVRSAHRKERSQ